jgi:glycosyltransferase involved in cell wall biosynthesis
MNRWVFDRLADRVTGVCEFSVRALSAVDGFRADRIEIVANGIDVTRYGTHPDTGALRERLRLDPSRRYVANVARFHPVKDHATLLRAFARVCTARADVDLLLVGDGPLRADLESMVGGFRIQDRVHFLGVRDDIPDILQAIDVFVLSSKSEAASITLLEAMASGTPVIATAVGGNPAIVRDGVDGVLTPRGDAAALAAAMLDLIRDRDTAREMGRSAARRVRERYSLDQTIERYHEIYADLCRPRTASRVPCCV